MIHKQEVKRWCSLCQTEIFGDYACQVDHMYAKHRAKSDEHAKNMVLMNVTTSYKGEKE